MMLCEMCNVYDAGFEAVVLVGMNYSTLSLCSICSEQDNVITDPVKMLDTNVHGG